MAGAGVFGKSIAKASAIQANLKSVNADVLAQFIDTSKIRCRKQTRRADNPGFAPDAIKELSDSIVANRQTDPIILRPDPDKLAEYLVVAGERRFRACALAGIPVLAFVWEMNDDQHRAIQIAENLHRADLTAQEVASELQVDYERLGTYEKVAVVWGKGVNWVHERIKFLNVITTDGAAQQAFNAGLTADVSTVNEIARLDKADPEAARALVESAAADPGMNLRRAAREALKETKATNATPNAPKKSGNKPEHAPPVPSARVPQQSIQHVIGQCDTTNASDPDHEDSEDGEGPALLTNPVAQAPAARTVPRLLNLTQFSAACNEAGGGQVRFDREEWIAACHGGELEHGFDNLETLLGRLAIAGVSRIEVEFGGLAE
ncbi:ParB/RepB/Spo0J family partition protein [Burkholderia gladioli]|uniref:ParB/RepB/Spo0J family partition protein n=1 Tax=Burkholderia gladioli TaxID=28095 RepID=UPI001C6031C5|nr:ParB/RepB/Spo0J family partition protein [Burkholderia gladioli]MBW5284093.1 ParB/RepB/Spo0J family partition protein [Burkholderia gladioli]